MKKRILSIALALILVIGPALPGKQVNAKTDNGWNTERYGDVLDIGTKLRAEEKNPEFRAKQDEAIKKSAERLNVNEVTSTEEEGSTFTFEGPTRMFVGYDSVWYNYFKTYTLRSIGNNVEVWVADDLAFYKPILDENGKWIGEELDPSRPAHVITQAQVDRMRDIFDAKVYGTDTAFFGTPDSHTGKHASITQDYSDYFGDYVDYTPESYTPDGYEAKERIMILVDNIRDENYYNINYPFIVAGFYSPTYEQYFDRNIISVDSSDWEKRLEVDWLPTTAHELQHLIHDDNDASEETWLNEGMSDFAEYLCFGEHPWGHVNYFLDHPENSLVTWDEHLNAETGPETLADYGQAYLLQLYMNDHYGREFIRALAQDKKQGIESVNDVLSKFNTGIDFTELFKRFTVALAVDSEQPGDGIYNFSSIDLKINYSSALTYDKDGVPAWGGDYKKINNASKIQSIIFDGIEFLDTPWKVVDAPLDFDSHGKVLWGNNGNLKDNIAIIEADLTGLDSATLTFDNYIDIEEGWDAGMVQVSKDGGITWTSLANENTIDQDDFDLNAQAPQIYYNLPGFTGTYNGWKKETFDLTEYAGSKVLVAFRYMTDAAANNTGWFIDNIAISNGYFNDCSTMDGINSLDKVTGTKVQYAVTFINEKSLGKGNNKQKYSVLNIDPFIISEADVETLKGFFSGGNNYMIVWYAAPVGKTDSVPFTYQIITKNQSNKKK